MSNLQTLEEKVQSMLDGERKRREVGIEFIDKVTEILGKVASDIWGTRESWEFENTIWVTKIDKEGKKKATDIYFRWEENTGFYHAIEYPIHGTEISELRGADLWYAIQVIKDWIPQVIEAIDKREESRQQLLDLLK